MRIDFQRNSRSLWTVWFGVMLFFIICIVFPLTSVVFSASISDFEQVAKSPIWRTTVLNTFIECICSTFCSVFIGYVFAYAVVKADIPGKKFFSMIPVLHLLTPPFVGGLAFILLLGRQGLITHKILGLDVSLYGFPGLLIAQTLCFFPMAYLICVQALEGINSNVEQAAKSLGAGNTKIFFTVTLPLSMPGIISSFLFVAVNILSDFGNPLIVAGRFRVLSVEIYTQLTGWLNIGGSAVLGIILVIPSVILFFIQNRMFQKQGLRISAIGGKSAFSTQNRKSRKGIQIILFIFVLFVSLCVILQLLSIVAGSFQKLWGIDTTFTLNHIKAIAKYSKSLKNSLLYSIIAAVFSTTIAVLSSYIVHRTDSPLRKTIDILAQLPSAIPGSLLGLSISIAAGKIHFRQSSVLIILAMTVAFMPFSYRVISQSFARIRMTLDDGARSLGSNQIQTLVKIILPLSAQGVFSGFVYDFIRGVGTLSAVIFLVSFKTPLTSIKIVNLAEQGDWGKSAALAMVLTIITFSVLGIGNFILKKWSANESSKS